MDFGPSIGNVCSESIDRLCVSEVISRKAVSLTRMSTPPVSGLSSRYRLTKCLANRLSFISSTLSKTRYSRSKREISVGGRSMLAGIGSLGSYRELIGFAAARMDVRAFKVVMIPALAIDTVCCSYSSALPADLLADRLTMTSCKTLRVESDILSNSSMQHTPPSDRTNAPDSRTSCFDSGSLVT
jgi:hypothetical protein